MPLHHRLPSLVFCTFSKLCRFQPCCCCHRSEDLLIPHCPHYLCVLLGLLLRKWQSGELILRLAVSRRRGRRRRRRQTEIEGRDSGPIFILISRLVGSVGGERSANKTKWQLLATAEAARLWAERRQKKKKKKRGRAGGRRRRWGRRRSFGKSRFHYAGQTK